MTLSGTPAKATPPAALVKPPLPGIERIIARLVVCAALLLTFGAPYLPSLADRIPGQTPTTTSGLTQAAPPQRMLANTLRALSRPPARWVSAGIAAGGMAIVVIELALAAGRLVNTRRCRRLLHAAYLRIRPLRPQSRKGAQHEPMPGDLWRSLHALEAQLRRIPGEAWISLTLSAQPEEPVTLGAVVVTPSLTGNTQTPAQPGGELARGLESLLLGQDAEVLLDRPDDPLIQALQPGVWLVWEELTLTRPPHAPLLTAADSGADVMGTLAASLRTLPGVRYTEIQVVAIPRRDPPNTTPWRIHARRRLVDLRRKASWAGMEEQRRLEAKLDSEAFDLTVRLIAVASDQQSLQAARAALREIRIAFGQYQQRGGNGVQRFVLAPFGSGQLAITPEPTPWRRRLETGLVWIVGIAATIIAGVAATNVGMPVLPALILPLAIWVTLRGALQLRRTNLDSPRLRAPALPFPARLLLPLPLWRGPRIVSSDEAAGMWHLPRTTLRNLVAWLPNRHLPAQPHVFMTLDTLGERLLLGEARTRDGALAPVGPLLRDVRQVLHITAGMGAGKSRALANIAAQLIQRLNSGLLLLDGKGDDAGCLAAMVRTYVPREAEARLMLIDLLDAEWPIGLNPFYGIDLRKAGGATQALGIVLALLSRLDEDFARRSMGMIQYIQMATILIVEGEDAPTFANLKQVLEDDAYRAELLPRCTNLEVLNFWSVVYPQTSDQQRNSLFALLRRFDNLLVDETTRYLLTQPVPTIDFLQAIEQGAIVLAPLPHRTLGGMAEFIGMLLLQAIMRAAFQRPGFDMSRTTVPLMIDELQVFIGAGDVKDIRDAVTQLRGFGIAGIYAHQTLAQLGDLRDELLTNSASRLILRTQEPDASVYARQYPTTDLTPADISGQHPNEHQYCILASRDAPAEVFSLRPYLWPAPVDADAPAEPGIDWQAALPGDTDALDQLILHLVYGAISVVHVAAQLALMPEDEWRLLLERWNRIRAYQRNLILTRPGCIPDRLERQRWLSRLWITTPRVLAAAVYQRQRWAIDPTETPAIVKPRRPLVERDAAVPATTAMVPGIAPAIPPLPPAMAAGKSVADALTERGRQRAVDDRIAPGFIDLGESE